MKRVKAIFFLGLWVVLLPYLGFPHAIKNILFVLSGISLMAIAFLIYKGIKKNKPKVKVSFENFSENTDFGKKEGFEISAQFGNSESEKN